VDYTKDSEFALWDKYEAIAMHFNDLIMRVRTSALGGLTGVVALSGIAINFTTKSESKGEWEILFATICFLAVAWFALWVLDWFYYTKLLIGAVEAIVAHEGRTPVIAGTATPMTRINLSTIVKSRVPCPAVAINVFYWLVLLTLIAGGIWAWIRMGEATSSAAPATEYKVKLDSDDGVKVIIKQVDTTTPITPATTSPKTNGNLPPRK
jgi:hypothetical protein